MNQQTVTVRHWLVMLALVASVIWSALHFGHQTTPTTAGVVDPPALAGPGDSGGGG